MPPRSDTEVDVEGRRLRLSNLDKVLYPATGLTKAGVIDYYRRIAPVMLPHLRGRAITLHRFPDGVGSPGFFEKNCPEHRPDWVETTTYEHRSHDGATRHCVVDDLPTLVWLANLAALELHAPMASGEDPDHPTAVVFDLDPGEPAGFAEASRVALDLRDALDHLGLASWPKTSGKKGVHVYVPLHGNTSTDHAGARDFAHALAEVLARRSPELVVTKMDKRARRNKVFVDWSQNARHKTTVAPYSLRAHETPSVSTPVTWHEVEGAAHGGDGATLRFLTHEVAERVDEHGDLFERVLDVEQELPAISA